MKKNTHIYIIKVFIFLILFSVLFILIHTIFVYKKNVEINSIIYELQTYKIAFNIFYEKFDRFPGDINRTNQFGECIGNGCIQKDKKDNDIISIFDELYENNIIKKKLIKNLILLKTNYLF